MDSLTHIAIGACIGEAVFSKKLGKKALFWGAVAQSFPDIDAVTSLWLLPAENLLVHRGLTHSILFALLAPLGIAWLFRRWYPSVSYRSVYAFTAFQFLLHDFLDLCNSYGTGILEPFSHQRLTLNLLYVIDPLFSVSLVVAMFVLVSIRITHPARWRWVWIGLVPTVLYACFVGFNKYKVNQAIESSLASQHLPYQDYFSTPTPLNGFLWYTAVQSGAGYQIGYRSVYDSQPVSFHYVPQDEPLLETIEDHDEVTNLKYFSRGYYTVDRRNQVVQFNVLRFGQIFGWDDPNADFAFHFYLSPTYDNRLVMQRGRFTGWSRQSIRGMFRRIQGN